MPTSWPAASRPTPRSAVSRSTVGAAERALERAGVTADGVIRVVDASMERALRVVSVERGVDPRSLALVAFGGAGPLHACALADALDMPAVIVPAGPACSPPSACSRHRSSATWCAPGPRRSTTPRWPTLAAALAAEAAKLVGRDAVTTTAVDCRYAGQSHELTVVSVGRVPRGPPAAQRLRPPRRAGRGRRHPRHRIAPERLRARPTFPRRASPARGPTAIAEPDCTIWLPDGWTAEPGAAGALVLRRRA